LEGYFTSPSVLQTAASNGEMIDELENILKEAGHDLIEDWRVEAM
jgi:hypothetical protein